MLAEDRAAAALDRRARPRRRARGRRRHRARARSARARARRRRRLRRGHGGLRRARLRRGDRRAARARPPRSRAVRRVDREPRERSQRASRRASLARRSSLPRCGRAAARRCARARAPAEDARAPTTPSSRARDIYARVLENRFRSFTQEARLVSGDRGGREQEIAPPACTWKDFRDAKDEPTRGVSRRRWSSTRIPSTCATRATSCIDERRARRTTSSSTCRADAAYVRVNLRGEAVLRHRLQLRGRDPARARGRDLRAPPDEIVSTACRCYVVEATPQPEADSEYSKLPALRRQEAASCRCARATGTTRASR